MKKIFKFGCLGVVGVIVLIGILAALAGKSTTATNPTAQQVAVAPKASEPTAAASASQPTSAPSEPEPTIAPTPAPAVGQDVRVGDIRWKVLSAENMGNTLKSDNEFIKDLKTSGSFVQVRFEIENLSNDAVTYASSAELKDDQNRKFNNSSDALFFIPDDERAGLLNLNPNITKTITEIYEVPAKALGLKFYVGSLKLFGNEESVIDLGLK